MAKWSTQTHRIHYEMEKSVKTNDASCIFVLKNMRSFILFSVVFLVSCTSVFAQSNKAKKDKAANYFGIVASPVIPNNFIGEKQTTFSDTAKNMDVAFNQKWGYSIGGIVRFGITKSLSIETGLTQVRRNFLVNVSVPDSNIFGKQRLAFVNYDVPINGLVYVPLSENWYMNALIGASITHYPTDVADSILPGFGKRINLEGRRTERTYFAANAGLGFEYRTKKMGTFYLGGSAKVPFKPIMFGVAVFKQSGNGNNWVAYQPISSGYFSIDFRYFLPLIKSKGDQPNKPIIE